MKSNEIRGLADAVKERRMNGCFDQLFSIYKDSKELLKSLQFLGIGPADFVR